MKACTKATEVLRENYEGASLLQAGSKLAMSIIWQRVRVTT